MSPPSSMKAIKFLILSASVIFLISGIWVYREWNFNYSNTEKILYIPPKTSLKKIAVLLKENGIIQNKFIFVWGGRILGFDQKVKSGEYLFKNSTIKGVYDILTSGKAMDHFITLIPGTTPIQLRQLFLNEKGLFGDIDEMTVMLLPETYQWRYGEEKKAVLKRMAEKFEKEFNVLWENKNNEITLSKEEIYILASMVEAESAISFEERQKVASVFYNRLKKGMKLQSDPTVIYGVTNGEKIGGYNLKTKDLKTDTPYNTYTRYGLPITAICYPSLDSIKAVLNPAKTQYLYFMADGKGGHNFSKTHKEHQKNVKKFYKK